MTNEITSEFDNRDHKALVKASSYYPPKGNHKGEISNARKHTT